VDVVHTSPRFVPPATSDASWHVVGASDGAHVATYTGPGCSAHFPASGLTSYDLKPRLHPCYAHTGRFMHPASDLINQTLSGLSSTEPRHRAAVLGSGQGMQWQQLAQKLQATPEAALPPRPKIKEPILKYKHVDPPHFMTAPVMCVPLRLSSRTAVSPPTASALGENPQRRSTQLRLSPAPLTTV
jgi:hypothetical protein